MDDIRAYNDRIDLLYSDWEQRHDMSCYTLIVPFALRENAPCTQKKMAEERLLPKQTVHTVIKKLQKKGPPYAGLIFIFSFPPSDRRGARSRPPDR